MSATDFNSKPIESEVFRFISVRNPQRITRTQSNRISFSYPIAAASEFYDDLKAAVEDPANATEAAKLAACKDLAESYKATENWLDDVSAVNSLIPSFDGLFDWLQLKLNGLTIAALTAKVTGLEIPSAAVCSQLWDNLFARLILGGYGASRTAIIESLMVNNLLLNYLDDTLVSNDGELRLMVNAKAVLPEGVFPLPGTNSPINTFTPSEVPDVGAEKEALLASINAYQMAIDELKDALDDVQEEIYSTLHDPLGSITVTAETIFPNLDPPISEEVFGNLSTETTDIMEGHDLGVGTRFSYSFKVLEKKLTKLNEAFFSGLEFGRKVVATGGGIWEASSARYEYEGCDPEAIPDIGTAQAYEDFYYKGLGNAQCRIKPLGIGDLLRVEQKLCCYAPGEVAHIENILQGEYKERATRRLRRTEETFISVTERESTSERDTITAEQHEMQNSTSTVLQEDMSFEVGLAASYLGPVKVVVNSNFATSTSSNEANASASSYAQSVTTRALQRIVERTREERIRTVIDEYEETNKHGLDNRLGTAHVVGLYRWADKIYEAKLVNYGKRLMFEFLIPEPGAFHLWAMAKPSAGSSVVLEEPIDPRTTQVSNFQYGLQPLSQTSINESNYAAWGRAYGIALDAPPLLEKIVSKSYSGAGFTAPFARNHIDLEVPSGYRAHSWNCAVLYDFLNSHSVCISIGTNQPNYLSGQFGVISANFPPNQVGEIPVSIIGDAEYFSINVHIWCVRLWTHMATWQKECFEKIMQAYFQKKSAYDQALAEAKAGYGNGYFGTNPAINRQIERNELKKGCLNALFNGLDFSSDAIGNYDSMDDCAPPMALADCCAIYEGERAKFLEQVFDWNFMSYLLYPYFHGKKCRWKKLYQLQDADPDFLKFLQAGMARVIVPVRPGFEEVAMHFLRTGQIWGGGPVPAIKSDLYLSITQEMMGAVLYAGEVVSPTWEIRVPTTLTVLQCGSACISGEGLPCDCGTGIGTGTPGTLTPGTADPVLPGSGG